MSEQEKVEIIGEVTRSKPGSYERQDEHGRVVHGDASGEWTLDENGDMDDIVFFVSPGAMRRRTAEPGGSRRQPRQPTAALPRSEPGIEEPLEMTAAEPPTKTRLIRRELGELDLQFLSQGLGCLNADLPRLSSMRRTLP